MLYSEILHEIKRTLKEPEIREGHWKNSELLRRANMIQDDICKLSLCLRKEEMIEMNTETFAFTKPVNCLQIEEVIFDCKRLEGRQEKNFDNLSLVGKMPDSRWRNDFGYPLFYYEDYRDIRLYPIPCGHIKDKRWYKYEIVPTNVTGGKFNKGLVFYGQMYLVSDRGVWKLNNPTKQIAPTNKYNGSFIALGIGKDLNDFTKEVLYFGMDYENEYEIWKLDETTGDVVPDMTDEDGQEVINKEAIYGERVGENLYFGLEEKKIEGIFKLSDVGTYMERFELTNITKGLWNSFELFNEELYIAGEGIVKLNKETGEFEYTNRVRGHFKVVGISNGKLYFTNDRISNFYVLEEESGDIVELIKPVNRSIAAENSLMFYDWGGLIFKYEPDIDYKKQYECRASIVNFNDIVSIETEADADGIMQSNTYFLADKGVHILKDNGEPPKPRPVCIYMKYYSTAKPFTQEEDVPAFDGIDFLQNAAQVIIDGVVFRCFLEDGNPLSAEYQKQYTSGLLGIRNLFIKPDTLEQIRIVRRSL